MQYTITINFEAVSPKVLKKFTPKAFHRYLKKNDYNHTMNDDGTIHMSYHGGDLLDYVLHINTTITLSSAIITATVPDLCNNLDDSDLASLCDKQSPHLTGLEVSLENGELCLHRECLIDGKDASEENMFSAIRYQCSSPIIWPVFDLIDSIQEERKNNAVVKRFNIEIGE